MLDRPTPTNRSLSRALLVTLGTLIASCQSTGVREVIDVGPAISSYEMVAGSTTSPSPTSGAVSPAESMGPVSAPLPGVEDQQIWRESVEDKKAPLWWLIEESQMPLVFHREPSPLPQVDPDLGPLDLGYPLLIDFGAGEAPYDDGVPSIFADALTRGGFSDALLQASWRERWKGPAMLHGTVAVSRYQDIGMLDGLEDMRFAWFVVGCSIFH